MKTTIELPDDLMVAVKVAVAHRRITLRKFVESALRREMRTVAQPPSRKRPFRWTTIPGGFAAGLDVANREKMYAWFDRNRDRD